MTYDIYDTTGLSRDAKAQCRECGWEGHFLGAHLQTVHGMDLVAYAEAYGGPVMSPALVRAARAERPEWFVRSDTYERKPATVKGLKTEFAGVEFPVNHDVPADACLPYPEHYKVPRHGHLKEDVAAVAVAYRCGRSVWVSGPQGTGKDAVFSALSAVTRTPALLLQVVPDADIRAWLYSRAFDAAGTRWEEGRLLRALRDGYLTPGGRRVPYLIVLSDVDRATRSQLEYLRLVLDSIEGRVLGPNGETYRVLPGTRVVATANSTGAGDSSGRYVSVNPVDSSILDRFTRKVIFHPMDERDETPILRAKFPRLVAAHPGALTSLMKGTAAVRNAVAKGDVYCDWSHRAVCAVCEGAEDLLAVLPEVGGEEGRLLRAALRTVLDGLPNEETRSAVEKLYDPHLKGGVVAAGATPPRTGGLRR